MNKQFIYLLFFYFFTQNSKAQNSWIKNFGSTQFDYTDKVSTDDLNNVYISGRMRTNMTIGDTNLVKLGSSAYNYFLAKFTENGQFIWALNVEAAPNTDPVSGLEIDKNQNVYLALEKPGIIYKISSNGVVLIKKTFNAFNARLSNIQIDKSLNIWVGGSFSNSNFSLDGLPQMPHLGGTGMYIAKLDTTLTAKFVIPIGSNSLSSRVGRIALKDSLIYVVTNSDNSVYIKNDTIKDARIITTCFDISGNLKWYKAIYQNGLLGGEQIWDIAVSDSNQVVIIGEFFRPIKIENNVLSNANDNDNFFIVSYNKDGNLLWAKKSNTIYSLGKAVKFTKEGKIAVIGNYNFSFSFGTSSIGDGVSNKSYPFLMTLDKNGNTEWIKSLGQSDWAYAIDLAIDKKGNWYLGGHFQATTTNVIDGKSLTVVGESDIFLLKNFTVAQPITGNLVFCKDGTPKTILATGIYIRWYSDSLLTNLIFTGNNLTINTDSNITVYVTQTVGSSESSPKKINILVNALTKVSILKNGNVLNVNPAVGKTYSWFKDSQYLSGQNTATYTPSAIGKYHALMIDNNNCYNYTDTFNFIPNSVFESDKISVNIYPNPCHEKLLFIKNESVINEVKVFNLFGDLILNIKGKNMEEISTLNFADGIYIIQLISENKTENKSFAVKH
ncbi:MAG: T9SS type A sorting domain-containing protein [Bacteroidia bacterium]|nr:T9SS type A sorting domain-containing protein [Bacteroidia bacterium]